MGLQTQRLCCSPVSLILAPQLEEMKQRAVFLHNSLFGVEVFNTTKQN